MKLGRWLICVLFVLSIVNSFLYVNASESGLVLDIQSDKHNASAPEPPLSPPFDGFRNSNEISSPLSVDSSEVTQYNTGTSISSSSSSLQIIAGEIYGMKINSASFQVGILQFLIRSTASTPIDLTKTSIYLSAPQGFTPLSPAPDFIGELSPGEWNISFSGDEPILLEGEMCSIRIMPSMALNPGSRIGIIIDPGYIITSPVVRTVPSLISPVTPLLKSGSNPVYDFESFGSIYGYDPNSTGKVKKVEIPIRLTSGRDPINMSSSIISVTNSKVQNVLMYDPIGSDGSWWVERLFGNQDMTLDEGELWILHLNLGGSFSSGDPFYLQIVPVLSEYSVSKGIIPTFTGNVTRISAQIPTTDPQSLPEEEERQIELVGAVYGLVKDSRLEQVQLKLSIPLGGLPVDLTRSHLCFITNDTVEYLDLSTGTPIAGEWGISQLIGNSDSLLEFGEILTISVVPEMKVLSGDRITIEIIPDVGKGCTLEGMFREGVGNLVFITPTTPMTDSLVVDGQIYGEMESGQIRTIRLYLLNIFGSSAIDLSKIEVLWSNSHQMTPVRLTPDYPPTKKMLQSGDRTPINLTILSTQGAVGPGESFNLEIKSQFGANTVISKTLATGYTGGVII